MINRIKNSWAYRSVNFYKFFAKDIDVNAFLKKPTAECVLVSSCGLKHLPMLKNCLASLIREWEVLPKKIVIYSDGTITKKNLAKQLSNFQNLVQIKDSEDIIFSDQNSELLQFAKENPVGKKLAILKMHAAIEPTIWCDADFLWFKSFPIIEELSKINGSFFLKTAEDYQPAYSKDFQFLNQNKPYINTGFILMRGDLDTISCFTNIWRKIDNFDHFTEQSILAYISKSLGLKTWPLNNIFCGQSDKLVLRPNYLKNCYWLARHYVGPVRHLFWRDSFFMRFKN